MNPINKACLSKFILFNLQLISKSSLLNSNVVKKPGGNELFSLINDLNKFFIPSGISLF